MIAEIQGNDRDADKENRNIGMTNNKKKNWRNSWDIVYVKDYKKIEQKTGDIDKYFGFRYNTDFHIVTVLNSRRYVDLIGNNLVIKTPNGRTS
jgi:hypothetical protein